MKKTVFFVLMILVLMVSSCNLFLTEEYGELILSFDGTLPDGARALGPDGLPILSTTSMKIDIIREDGYTVTRELSAEEPKSLVELVPVGEKIEIIVTAYNASSQWSGRTAHTVTSGQNHVRVLLNKNVSGLKNLLFTQTGDGQHGYNLTLYMDGKGIMAPGSNPSAQEKPYSFARDSRGRLYVRYKKEVSGIEKTYLARYTSEGEPDGSTNSVSGIEFLANDYTTGKIYGIDGSRNVYEIKENLSLLPTSIAYLDEYQGAAAIDNNRVVWIRYDDPNNLEMSVKYLGPATVSPTDIKSDVTITGCEKSKVNDLFIRGDYVYVLFNTVNESAGSSDPNLYSLGGIARYNINNLTAPPVKIGFSNSVNFQNSVLKNYDYSKNFYGALKVIGFDEENIYIADDGFDAAYVDYAPHIIKNRNRIAALNMETNAVSFTDEYTAKWYNEWKEWEGVKTKILLWEEGNAPTYFGMKYWIGDTAGTPCPSNDDDALWVSNAQQVLPTDVFCYDQGGNLYIYMLTVLMEGSGVLP